MTTNNNILYNKFLLNLIVLVNELPLDKDESITQYFEKQDEFKLYLCRRFFCRKIKNIIQIMNQTVIQIMKLKLKLKLIQMTILITKIVIQIKNVYEIIDIIIEKMAYIGQLKCRIVLDGINVILN